MGRIHPIVRPDFEGDFRAAWEAIHSGVVDATTKKRRKYWTAWCKYANSGNTSPYLDRKNDDPIIILTGFAARVRSGFYGWGKRVGVQSVSDALGAISKTIEMGGGVSPIYREPGKYLLPLERMVESYRRQDPPPIPQLAVPVLVAESCYETGNQKNATPRMRATGELSIIAFYFLLRIGEYTMPSRIHERWDNRLTRTVQFTVGNVSFWREGLLLDITNATDISNADEATMSI